MVQHFMGLVGNEWVDQDQLDASPVLSRITVMSHRLENSIKKREKKKKKKKKRISNFHFRRHCAAPSCHPSCQFGI